MSRLTPDFVVSNSRPIKPLNLTGVLRSRTSYKNATGIAERNEGWEQTLRMTCAKCRLLHEATDKMVKLAPRIGLIQRSQYERKHLQRLQRCAGHGECKHVLA